MKNHNIWKRSGSLVEKIEDGTKVPFPKFENKLVLKSKEKENGDS